MNNLSKICVFIFKVKVAKIIKITLEKKIKILSYIIVHLPNFLYHSSNRRSLSAISNILNTGKVFSPGKSFQLLHK